MPTTQNNQIARSGLPREMATRQFCGCLITCSRLIVCLNLVFCLGGCNGISQPGSLFSSTHKTYFRESNLVEVRSQDTALPGGWAGVEVGDASGPLNATSPPAVVSEQAGFPGAHSIGPGRPRLGTPRLLPPATEDHSGDSDAEADVKAIEISAGPSDMPRPMQSTQPVVSEDDFAAPEGVPAVPESPAAGGGEPESPGREKTVLDRLKGLYPSRLEESSADLFRKNLRRLQNPWNRGNEPPPTIEIPAASLEQTAEVPGTDQGPIPDTSLTPIVEGSGTQQLLGQLIEAMESEINSWPRDELGQPERPAEWRTAQADLRLLYLVASRPADAVSAIGALPPAEQEFWQAMMLGLSHYRSSEDASLGRDAQLNATAEQLRAAVRHLQAMAPLTIPRLTFASRIHGFGSIETYPAAEFNPGQPVLIYAEIDNFRSNLTSTGTYQSEFMAVVDLLRLDQDDPEEHVVESIRVPSIVDESLTQRTDYFQSYELTIPSHLTSGRYQVRLRIRDQQSSQQAESKVEFTVR